MRNVFGSCAAIGLAALALFASGCSDEPEVFKVTGTATRNGQPVPNLFINFMPDNGRPSWAISDAQGKFKLNYDEKRDGAVGGTHTVWVQWRPANPSEEVAAQDGTLKRPADLEAILAKYGQQSTTPLRIEISRKNREIELKLD